MSDAFNPYQQWLGLHVVVPASHYELLSLRLFEPDIHVISAAANNAMNRVRGVQPGPNAASWTQLLDEIAAAWNCLADPAQRAQYDHQLRQRYGGISPTSMPSRPLPRVADGAVPAGGPPSGYEVPPSGAPFGSVPPAGYPQVSPQATAVPYGALYPGSPQQALPPGQAWGSVSPGTYAPAMGQPYVPQGQFPGQFPPGSQPMVGQPYVGQPATGYPAAWQPMPGQPTPGLPMTPQSYAQPTPGQPVAPQPYPQPTAGQLNSPQPYGQPTPGQAMASYPGTGQPMFGYAGPVPAGTPAQFNPPPAPAAYVPPTRVTPSVTPPPGGSPAAFTSASHPQLPSPGGLPRPGNLPSGGDPMAPVNHVLVAPVGGPISGRSTSQAASGGSRPVKVSASPAAVLPVKDKPGDAKSDSGKRKKRLSIPLIGGIVGVVMCAAIVGLACYWGGDSDGSRETANATSRDEEGSASGLSSDSEDAGGGESASGTTDDSAVAAVDPVDTPIGTQTDEVASASVSPDGSETSSNDGGRQSVDSSGLAADVAGGDAAEDSGAGVDDSTTTGVSDASVVGANPPPDAVPDPRRADGVAESATGPVRPPTGSLPGTSGAQTDSATPPARGGSPGLPVPSEQELVDLGRALTRTRMFLGSQDYGNASRELARAEQLARLPEHVAKVERLKLLTDYTQQFWAAFRDGLKTLSQPGQELVIDGEQVAVVEVDASKIILRARGQNKTFPMGDLPDKLVMAIADLWFNKNAASSNVFRGAFYATGPNADPATARRLWEEAQRAGADVADLMPVLTDSYDLTAELNR